MQPSSPHFSPLLAVAAAIGSFALVFFTTSLQADAPSGFSDDFEPPTLHQRWSLTQNGGAASLSTQAFVSGAQSLELRALGSDQHDVWASFVLPQATVGTLSVKFLDTGATMYAGPYARNSAIPEFDFASNIADWSPANFI